jgi:hypothetical protein
MSTPARLTHFSTCIGKDAPPRRVTGQRAGDEQCRRRKNRPDCLFHCPTPNRPHELGRFQSKKTGRRNLQRLYRKDPLVPFGEIVRTSSRKSLLVRLSLPPNRTVVSHYLPRKEFARLSLPRESTRLRYVKRQREPHSR